MEENSVPTSALQPHVEVKRFVLAREFALMVANVSRNANGFVLELAFVKDYLVNGSTSVHLSPNKFHSRSVSLIAPKRSKLILAQRNVQPFVSLTSTESVSESWFPRRTPNILVPSLAIARNARNHARLESRVVSEAASQRSVEDMFFNLANGNAQPLQRSALILAVGRNKKNVT